MFDPSFLFGWLLFWLVVGFVVFLGVIIAAGLGGWALWALARRAHGHTSADGKSEVITLLAILLVLVLGGPFLFGALLFFLWKVAVP